VTQQTRNTHVTHTIRIRTAHKNDDSKERQKLKQRQNDINKGTETLDPSV